MTNKESTRLSDAELDALFDQARQATADPSPDLMARILADAEAEMPKRPAEVWAMPAAPKRGLIAQFIEQIGGFVGLSGLAMAGAAGLLIGNADIGFQDIAAQAVGLEIVDYDLSDLYPDFAAAQEGL